MSKVNINNDACKGCELCVTACPKKILKVSAQINKQGYHFAEVENHEQCIGCAMCATMCPDCAIEIKN